MNKMKEIVGDKFTFWDHHTFVELRDCACARLTLINARRGGEPARLLLSDWNDAEQGVWIDNQRVG